MLETRTTRPSTIAGYKLAQQTLTTPAHAGEPATSLTFWTFALAGYGQINTWGGDAPLFRFETAEAADLYLQAVVVAPSPLACGREEYDQLAEVFRFEPLSEQTITMSYSAVQLRSLSMGEFWAGRRAVGARVEALRARLQLRYPVAVQVAQ